MRVGYKMKKLIITLLITLPMQPVFAKQTKVAPQKSEPTLTREVATARAINWANIRADLVTLTERFKSPAYTSSQKLDMLPATNELLSYMQDLKFNPAEKRDQISVVVQLLEATLATDLVSSNADTVYYDYEKFKPYYMDELSRLPNKKAAAKIMRIFSDLSQVEIDNEEAGI